MVNTRDIEFEWGSTRTVVPQRPPGPSVLGLARMLAGAPMDPFRYLGGR